MKERTLMILINSFARVFEMMMLFMIIVTFPNLLIFIVGIILFLIVNFTTAYLTWKK